MTKKRHHALSLRTEIIISLVVGAVGACVIPKEFISEVDEYLINAVSIVIGAAIAGLSLTAAAARPSSLTVAGARHLGDRLKLQISFWFGFVKFGGLAILMLVIGHGLKWQLPFSLTRPSVLPSFTPDTSAWLLLPSVAAMTFVAVRISKIINAMSELVELGTTQHIENIVERNKDVQQKVASQIAAEVSTGKPKAVERPRSPSRQ